ncbi:hypothetical protein MUK42_07978 [Musa troglodytarum]|uniref:Flavodoxin-like domain-containing protein n=1 Tax=Musa troglodytarum TaxID=320322 RepID=A0A9E7G597_9LILI|nr:hypothetical protein MUK42_07978 [Musa troglodytarum]
MDSKPLCVADLHRCNTWNGVKAYGLQISIVATGGMESKPMGCRSLLLRHVECSQNPRVADLYCCNMWNGFQSHHALTVASLAHELGETGASDGEHNWELHAWKEVVMEGIRMVLSVNYDLASFPFPDSVGAATVTTTINSRPPLLLPRFKRSIGRSFTSFRDQRRRAASPAAMVTKIYIVYYSMYGHVEKLAEEIHKGASSVEGV